MVKILVIGESCMDKFIYSETKRLSPEAPVPIIKPMEISTNNGMAGNVVENLKSLNFNLDIVLWSQPEIIIKTRYVDKKSNHMFFRIDEGEEVITPFKLNDILKSQIQRYDIVIVSDYSKGFLNNDDLVQIGKNSKLSIIDSKRSLTKEIINSFTFVKLNEQESEINQKFVGEGNIIITLGKKGCLFNGEIFTSPKPQETIDVSGAGDTFTASFILKYFETKNIKTSIVFANEMSAQVVSKRGVATPN